MKLWDLPSSGTTAALLILSVSFLLGGLAGCLFAGQVGGGGGEVLGDYLEDYLTAVYSSGAARPDALSLLWEIVRWPLFVLALSLTPLGLLGLPVLFLVRGFLLSFSISTFFRMLGLGGLALAFVVFGISGLICVCVLFVLGVQGFLTAGALAGRLLKEGARAPLFDRLTLPRLALCAAALCACGFLEYCVTPVLLESLAGLLVG